MEPTDVYFLLLLAQQVVQMTRSSLEGTIRPAFINRAGLLRPHWHSVVEFQHDEAVGEVLGEVRVGNSVQIRVVIHNAIRTGQNRDSLRRESSLESPPESRRNRAL